MQRQRRRVWQRRRLTEIIRELSKFAIGLSYHICFWSDILKMYGSIEKLI